MIYTIRPGESLSDIAQRYYGAAGRWREIAVSNKLRDPNVIFAGETLALDGVAANVDGPARTNAKAAVPNPTHSGVHRPGTSRSLVAANYYVFVLADEIDPTARKIVRRVVVNRKLAADLSKQIGKPVRAFANPERYGFVALDPDRLLSIGRHAQGITPSPYISTSGKLLGARRFQGKPFWIDVRKAKAAGSTVHDTHEIVADLDRILARTTKTNAVNRLKEIRSLVAGDKEVILKGAVPPAAVKGAGAMALTRGLQGVQVVGFALTAYDLSNASERSLREHSARPITAEAIRQAGGWTTAWAGMKLGAAAGALCGIETGPGAVATAAIGGVVGGVAGYFGFDWVADHIDKN